VRPLRAAVDHDLDPETFRDLMANEEWWGPFRDRAALVVGLSGGDTTFGADAAALRDRELIERARPDEPAVGWTGSNHLLVAAAVEVLVGKGPRHVLVLGRPVDESLLQRLAGKTRAALLLTDGKSAGAFAGPEEQRGNAAALVGAEGTGPRLAGTWVATPVPVLPGRWIWAVREAAGGGPFGALALGLFALAALSALAAVIATVWRPVRARAPHPNTGWRAGETQGPAARASSFHLTQIAAGHVQTFGRYTLVERIGEGGMSELFAATLAGAEGFQRLYVIKRLKPEFAQHKGAIDQFIDEAKLGSQLVHSNIVPIFDFGKVGNGYYLAQEYISGRNLAELCDRHRERLGQPLGPALTCYIAYEVLEALAYAHARTNDQGEPLHIVHRDISTGNIMVTAQGEVKLLDFGIVRAAGRVSSTELGHIKGNAVFMAPEQARGQPVDGRTDLFSLGMVVYYGLTGRPLYQALTSAEAFYQATTGLTADHLALLRSLADPLPAILEKALSLDPGGRYPDARAFADALAPHVGGMKNELATLMSALFGDDLRRQTASFRAKLGGTAPSAQIG
jgi:serine/threonine-protein kinase